jgi:hypothetical protein
MLRHILVACLAALSSSSGLYAQKLDSSCAIAAEKLRTLSRLEDGGRYLNSLGSCGVGESPAIAPAIAAALMNSRQSRDTVWLGRLSSFAGREKDPAIVEALLEIMQERQATKEARISAMLALIGLKDPSRYVTYKDITGGLDAHGLALNGCRGGIVTDAGDTPPLPPGFYARVVAAAHRIYAEESNDIDVRTAAACVERVSRRGG